MLVWKKRRKNWREGNRRMKESRKLGEGGGREK